LSRVHALRFRTTAALAVVLTSGAVTLAACGSATEQGRPATNLPAANAPATSPAAAANAPATSPAAGATDPAHTAPAPARSATTTAARAATTARAPVRAQPSHHARKGKSVRRAVVPSHLMLPPPPVHHLVTPLMPLRVHPMTSEHLPPMPSPARLERPVS
jgi:hypothetical protein